jgi:hypothetical protein
VLLCFAIFADLGERLASDFGDCSVDGKSIRQFMVSSGVAASDGPRHQLDIFKRHLKSPQLCLEIQ